MPKTNKAEKVVNRLHAAFPDIDLAWLVRNHLFCDGFADKRMPVEYVKAINNKNRCIGRDLDLIV